MHKHIQLIRGARIVQQMLRETTLATLDSNTGTIPSATSRDEASSTVRVKAVKMIPYKKNGQLEVTSTTTNQGKTYNTTIMFLEVQFQDTDEPTNISFVSADGENYNIIPLRLADVNVKVRCECLDFYWRFANWNNKDGSLHGAPPAPYVKKTDRQSPNPGQVPGICKHLMKSIEALQQSGIIV